MKIRPSLLLLLGVLRNEGDNTSGHIIVDKASDPYITEDKETHNIRVCIVVEDDKGGKHLIDFPMRIAELLFKGTRPT